MQIVVIIPNVNTETLSLLDGPGTRNFKFSIFLSLDKLDLFDTKVN